MLGEAEHKILLQNCFKILKNPNEITRKEFNIVYNTVYTHCSAKSETYTIKGEEIYNFLENVIDSFCKKIEFTGSCDSLAVQIQSFEHSVDILSKVFSYLERFYIRTSILNCADVRKIKDLFYFKIYYNFLYRAEESFLNVIFLEVETFRNFHKRDLKNLKIIIQFYLEALARNGLETSMNNFYRQYVSEFKTSFDINCSIKDLIKKIHMEIYITTNIFNDHEVTREIISSIESRKDEIMKYAFSKVSKFEKLKHIYSIISKMSESVRIEFKQRYESFIETQFCNSENFEQLYQNYCNIVEQTKINKMHGFIDLVDECMSRSFKERSNLNQLEIFDTMVNYVDTEFCTNHPSDESNDKVCRNVEIFFNFFSSIVDDRLIDKYISRTQNRLINGFDPSTELYLGSYLLEKLGLGMVSRLNNSILGFLNKKKISYELGLNSIEVSLAKITKGFWNIEKNEVNLHSDLEIIKDMIYEKAELEEKQKIEFNYSVSPIIFKLNSTKYKLPTDVFSIYYYILNGENVNHEELKIKCGDKNFDKNIQRLISMGLVEIIPNIDTSVYYRAVDRQVQESYIDLFSCNETVINKKEIQEFKENKIHIIESQICKFMKKNKFISKDLIFQELQFDPLEVENAITNLVAKEYLEIINGVIHYIP